MNMPFKVFIFDIDNCLADDSHRIKLIDWSTTDPEKRYAAYHAACIGDPPPLQQTIEFFRELAYRPNTHILFITGRPELVREETQVWLRTYLPTGSSTLLMRPHGCELSSVELKRTLLHRYLTDRGLAKVIAAFDDHVGILEMYRDYFGIPAFQLKIHDLDAYRNEHELSRHDGGHQAYLDRLDDERPIPAEELGPVQGARPVPKITAADQLEVMAKTFRERNGVYRDNYMCVPEMVKALFGEDGPEGSMILRPEWHLFELILVKLARFARSGLTHIDSIHDAAVYGAMIDAILTTRQRAAQPQKGTPEA